MSSLFDSLSEELFQVLKGSGKTLTLYGSDGNKTYEPKSARRVFATPDNIMVSVVEAGTDSEVKLYMSQSTDVKAISSLINTLRMITTRYNVLFNVRKYGRELQPKDFAYQASVTESSMWGSTRTSYQKIGSSKLIIRHCRPIAEGVFGSRGRNILSMFVETKQGERFKFAENHLSAGRAFAQHIDQGGKPHDDIGTKLTILAQESLHLARVNRYIHHSRNVLGEEAVALRGPIKNRIVELRRAFLSMSRPRGYHAVKESLPISTATLNETTSDRLGQLESLLMIDSNHALAESLMPVALLQMGENMTTKNSMFHGVLTLEAAVADALVEALLDEYGHAEDTWTRYGSNIAFNEAAIFEDATGYLDLVESSYMISEADAVMDYATQWTQHRFAKSGARGFDDNKDRRKHEQGIQDLANGIRAILDGHFDVPALPETGMPHFSKTDGTAEARYLLDLYVSRSDENPGMILLNDQTENYVSTIIDKLVNNKPLDGAEKTIAGKLIHKIQKDMGEVDESYFMPSSYGDDDEREYEEKLQELKDTFNAEEFVDDIFPFVQYGEEKDEALDKAYALQNLNSYFKYWMNYDGFNSSTAKYDQEAEDVFPQVQEYCEERGYFFDEQVQEFAEMDEKPEHHAIATGDHVATDMGPGVVATIEGDIAVVEFLHGGSKQMHVDDMDKVPALANFGEEAELSEWFDSFNPEAVLDEVSVNWAHGVPDRNKIPAPKAGEYKVGDRVTHPKYGQGSVVAGNGKLIKVEFDNAHDNLPEYRTVTLTPGSVTKASVGEAEELDELSRRTLANYINRATIDSEDARADASKYERYADQAKSDAFRDTWDDMADKSIARSDRRKAGIKKAIDRVSEVEELDELSNAKMADYFSKAASARSRDERKAVKHGDDAAAGRVARRDKGLSTAFKKMREDEEVLGGDKGEDLIDDVKVQEVDETFRAELANVLKNARFRR